MAIRWPIRTLTCFLLVLSCGGLAGCGEDAKPSAGATASTAESPTAAAPSRPPGGPAPAELIGTWKRVVTTGDSDNAVTFDADHFRIVDGPTAAQGEIVVDGDEIYFFNVPSPVDPCLSVGSYQWRLRGATLHFTPINNDPCPLRHERFTNQDYTKGAS